MGNGAVKMSSRNTTEPPSAKNTPPTSHTTSDTPSGAQESDSPPLPIMKAESYGGKADAERPSLDDVLGEPGSTRALYIKKNVVGRGAFGEAFIVEGNAAYVAAGRNGRFAHRFLAVVDGDERDTACQPALFVAKVLNLTCMSDGDRQYAQTEIMCLANTDHFAIIGYYEHFYIDDECQTTVIITEFADKGDVYQNLHNMPSDRFLSESEAGVLFVQLLLGLDHIHRRRMIHRDIKTANIFLTSRGFLKLGDFGFSKQYDTSVSNPIAVTFLGTSYYLSPEMLKGQRYGKKADIWAAGIVLCELLGKRRPFEALSPAKLKELVLSGDMWLPPAEGDDCPKSGAAHGGSGEPRRISREMREFLEYTLQLDPYERPSASQLLKTPLMQHYLHVFKKQVCEMTAADDGHKSKGSCAPNAGECAAGGRRSGSLSVKERALVLRGIAEGEDVITSETERQNGSGTAGRMEGTVFKGVHDGRWKERYLSIADGYLTITLTKEKCISGSNTRSKRVPLDAIKSVSPLKLFYPTLAEEEGGVANAKKYAFVLSTVHSQSILFATATEEERDRWLSVLMFTLNMG